MGRTKALEYLAIAGKRIERAQRLFGSGEDLSVVRMLEKARRSSERAVVALLGECLQEAWSDARSDDRVKREQCLDELIPLIELMAAALCPACQHKIAIGLQEEGTSGEKGLGLTLGDVEFAGNPRTGR